MHICLGKQTQVDELHQILQFFLPNHWQLRKGTLAEKRRMRLLKTAITQGVVRYKTCQPALTWQDQADYEVIRGNGEKAEWRMEWAVRHLHHLETKHQKRRRIQGVFLTLPDIIRELGGLEYARAALMYCRISLENDASGLARSHRWARWNATMNKPQFKYSRAEMSKICKHRVHVPQLHRHQSSEKWRRQWVKTQRMASQLLATVCSEPAAWHQQGDLTRSLSAICDNRKIYSWLGSASANNNAIKSIHKRLVRLIMARDHRHG